MREDGKEVGLVLCSQNPSAKSEKGKYFALVLVGGASGSILTKNVQIIWPEESTDEQPTFLYSVDGVHCRTNEMIHPTLAKNTKNYSHKFNQAGVGYELAISVVSNALIWMNGPFVGSRHDVTIFRENGLKAKTPAGKKGIADNGYRGEKGTLSTPNSHDPAELRKFKVSFLFPLLAG
jgi:hypothetical protein